MKTEEGHISTGCEVANPSVRQVMKFTTPSNNRTFLNLHCIEVVSWLQLVTC